MADDSIGGVRDMETIKKVKENTQSTQKISRAWSPSYLIVLNTILRLGTNQGRPTNKAKKNERRPGAPELLENIIIDTSEF